MSVTNQDSLATRNNSALLPMGSNGSTEGELSLTEIFRTIFKHKLIVLCTTVAIFCAVVAYTVLKKPVYESVASLQIDPSRSSDFGLDDMLSEKLGTGDASSRIQTEVKVIQSDTVAMRVIDALALAKQPAFAGKKAIGARVTDPLAMSARDRERLINAFQDSLKVAVLPNTQLVEIRFRSTDARLATDVANSVVEKYMERNLQTRYEGTVQVSNWLSKQMEDLQTKAAEDQQKLAEFQKQNNILGADENDNIVIDRLKLLNGQVTEAEADRIVKEARHRMAKSGNPELIASVVPNSNLQILRTQEADLKAQLAQLTSKYGSGYPKVRELQVQLSRLDAAISEEVNNVGKRLEEEYLAAAKTESLLRDQFNEQKDKAFKLNEHAVQYAVLKHDVENGRELYDTLQLKLKMAGVTAGLSSSYINVVDRAQVPDKPVQPRVALNLILGLLVGSVTGLVLAFVVESLDDTLSSSEELESFIALPVLCSIPYDRPGSRPKPKSDGAEIAPPSLPLIVSYPRSKAAEAFRGLRSSLLLSSPDRQPKIIAVVSSLAAEGKTTVSVNLGVSFAQRGESVLLIDADLRRSSVHTQFNLPDSRYGTSTVLTQGMNDRAILTPLESLPNLHLMPAGPHPPNPAELLGSKRMAEMLASLATKYDRIIIDTAPILSVSDSMPLANIADAVVLVVRSGIARRKAVLRVRDLLGRVNSNVLGIVFNGVNLQLERYYYAHRSYYGKASTDYYYDDSKEDSTSTNEE
jgi:capsular exopolysaccharide synthesis family protein